MIGCNQIEAQQLKPGMELVWATRASVWATSRAGQTLTEAKNSAMKKKSGDEKTPTNEAPYLTGASSTSSQHHGTYLQPNDLE